MRLQNGLELTYNKETNMVKFSKLIGNKLRWLETSCKSCNMLFMIANGYSQYSDEQFMAEVEATKN